MSDGQKRVRFTEWITITGAELVDYVKDLIEEGKVRRIIIRKPGGDVLLKAPLAAGIAVSAVLILIVPVLTALGAMAALVAKVQVDIVRRDDNDD